MKCVYNESIVSVNGNCIEEFFFFDNQIVASVIKYEGKDHADAINNLMAYWHAPEKHSVPHTLGIL